MLLCLNDVSLFFVFCMKWTSKFFQLDVDKCRRMKCCSSTKCNRQTLRVGTSNVIRTCGYFQDTFDVGQSMCAHYG